MKTQQSGLLATMECKNSNMRIRGEKSPGACRPWAWRTHTPSALQLKWSFLGGGRASGSAKKEEMLTCLTGKVSCNGFITKKKSSQYGPYLVASFHARAITRICKISGRHTYGHTASHAGPSKLIIQRKPCSNTNSKHKSLSRLHTTWKY